MHKHIAQFKWMAFLIIFLWASLSALQAQHRHTHQPLLEVQEAFLRGEVNVDQAMRQQLDILDRSAIDETTSNEHSFTKCATPALMFWKEHHQALNKETEEQAERYFSGRIARMQEATNQMHISPSGKFEIYYTTSGDNAVPTTDTNSNGIPDYVEWVAESADSSYRHEVRTLQFPDPIPPGETYEVYVVDGPCGDGVYGCTESLPGQPVETRIYIENDFAGFPSNTHPESDQKGAVYVTMAHEFKHAIQYLQNRWQGNSNLWTEMDATLMEEVVYDDVNDYYNYIDDFATDLFSSSAISVIPGSYEDVTWAIYFYEKYGDFFWTNVWRSIEQNNAIQFLEAVENELSTYNVSFSEAVTELYLWHLASGELAPECAYGFSEKEDYPTPQIFRSFEGVPDSEISFPGLSPHAARYLKITPSAGDNGYVDVAVDFDSTQVSVGLLFYLKNGEVVQKISAGEGKPQVFLPSDLRWEEIQQLGIVIANQDVSQSNGNLFFTAASEGKNIVIRDPDYVELPEEFVVYQNFPNPFNQQTNFRFELHKTARVKLDIFDITGRKITTLIDKELRLGTYTQPFQANRLSSGMYLYRLRIDNQVFLKKMTFIK